MHPSRIRPLFPLLMVLLLATLSGCAGQLKAALLDHAKSTRAIAETLGKATAAIQCEGSKDAASCQAALATIADQAKALEQGAGKLESAGR